MNRHKDWTELLVVLKHKASLLTIILHLTSACDYHSFLLFVFQINVWKLCCTLKLWFQDSTLRHFVVCLLPHSSLPFYSALSIFAHSSTYLKSYFLFIFSLYLLFSTLLIFLPNLFLCESVTSHLIVIGHCMYCGPLLCLVSFCSAFSPLWFWFSINVKQREGRNGCRSICSYVYSSFHAMIQFFTGSLQSWI